MSELTRSSVIEYVAPATLKSHPRQVAIYGEEPPDEALIASVKKLGIQAALYVKVDGVVISGHRRRDAALAAGLGSIPVIRVGYASEADEREALVEHNRTRVKTAWQALHEGYELVDVEKLRAAVRADKGRKAGGKLAGRGRPNRSQARVPETYSENGRRPNAPQARDVIAGKVGLKNGRDWERLQELGAKADVGNPVAQKMLREVLHKRPISTALKLATQHDRRAAETVRLETIKDPKGQYSVLVIDPPWHYNSRAQDLTHRSKNPYRSMTQAELEALKLPAADDAILWLWTTNAFMHSAFHLLEKWEFTPKTVLTWAKNRIGTGDWLRGQTEHCILAVRGKYRITPGGASTLLKASASAHSAKPDAFYVLVERLCPGPKIEMFARSARPGWDVWGAEAPDA